MLDKVVANKETRAIARITKNVRKYKKVIASHHVIAVFEGLGFELPLSIKLSPSLNEAFTEKFELSKTLAARVSKTLELEAFVKMLLVALLWKEGNLEDCLKAVQ